MQSTVLTSTLVVLVLTLKVCYGGRKIQPYQLTTALHKLLNTDTSCHSCAAVQEINKTANIPPWKGYKQTYISQINGWHPKHLKSALFQEKFPLTACYCRYAFTIKLCLKEPNYPFSKDGWYYCGSQFSCFNEYKLTVIKISHSMPS